MTAVEKFGQITERFRISFMDGYVWRLPHGV